MKLWTKIKNKLKKTKKNNRGCVFPGKHILPMTPQQELKLRDLQYDCPNVMIALMELDRVNELLREQDHELWVKINKGKNI